METKVATTQWITATSVSPATQVTSTHGVARAKGEFGQLPDMGQIDYLRCDMNTLPCTMLMRLSFCADRGGLLDRGGASPTMAPGFDPRRGLLGRAARGSLVTAL